VTITMRHRLRGWLAVNGWDVVIVLVLALLPALFFWRLIAPNPIDRMGITAGDFTDQYYPLRSYAAQQLIDGTWPLWNPMAYAGQPALADIQSGALYPPQMLQAGLLKAMGLDFPLWALELQVILHFSWAAVGAYLLGKALLRQRALADETFLSSSRSRRFVGVAVSLVFTYSGYMTGFPVQQLTILEVSCWLPWVLLALDALAHRVAQRDAGQVRMMGLAGLTLGMALLPGHPQTFLYVVYLAGIFFLWRIYHCWDSAAQDSRIGAYWLRAAGGLAGVFVFALALTAAQWLPTAEFIARSPRADMSYQAVSFGLPLHELVSVLYPGYFGGSPEYVGILPLVLIALALLLGRPRREIVFWAVIGVAALLLAFGGNTFLYALFYLLAPGFKVVRQQERAFLVFAISAAVLAGYGAAVLARSMSEQERVKYDSFRRSLSLVFGVAVVLTFLFYFGWVGGEHRDLFGGALRHHVFGVLLLGGSLVLLSLNTGGAFQRGWGMALLAGWIAFNGFSVNWRFNLAQPQGDAYFAPTPVTAFLQQVDAPQPFRIASGGLLPGGSGASSVYGLQDIIGNTPLHLASLEMFEQVVPEWRRWQLLNVHYVISDRDLTGPGMEAVFVGPSPTDGESPPHTVYRMGDPFPRAWVVHQWEVLPSLDAALQRIGEDSFDLRQMVVLDRDPEMLRGTASLGSEVSVVHYASNRLALHVDAQADGVVIVSEISYPGWRASVDGETVEVLGANGILRGIPVSAGTHEIELWYAPNSFRVGMALSGLAVLALAAAWALDRRCRPRG
jgi:hypothetical protein